MSLKVVKKDKIRPVFPARCESRVSAPTGSSLAWNILQIGDEDINDPRN